MNGIITGVLTHEMLLNLGGTDEMIPVLKKYVAKLYDCEESEFAVISEQLYDVLKGISPNADIFEIHSLGTML